MKRTLTPYMFWIAFVASLGGLLFGFDTAVISGAEGAIQKIYGLSDFAHGFTMATALIGTILGALFCGRPAKRFGRLRSLQVIALLYLISAVGSAWIVNWYSFMFFRFIGGLAVGASSVIGPMYIAEISPAAWRGRFVAFFQFNIVLGIVLAYFSNYFIAGVPNDWQWMIGAESLPALLFAVLLFTVPESPRWLVSQGRDPEAEGVFARTGEADIPGEMEAIRASFASASGTKKERLFQRKFRKPVLIALLLATFNQLSGINAILYYAPRLFELSGVFRDGAMLQSVIVGLTNLTFTILGMVLIDKLGRKTLLAIGAVGMVVAQALVARGFYLEAFQGYYLLICICAYIAFFALSLGATIWVIIAEVFPNSVRAEGQVFGSMTHWVWSALLTWFFPLCLSIGGQYIFSFFTVIAGLSFLFALWMPETKGKSLETIQKELVKE
ncbi:MAG: sugar porter family MFS transporter [Bacteroidales bacterium]|nr:sugar porter family MFS transporter [Bacteroidales bacterium]